MASRPDIVQQFAHHLARDEPSLRHADWILPLTVPFERPEPRTGRDELDC